MLNSFLIVNPQWPLGTFLVPLLLGRDSDNRVYAVGFHSDSYEHYVTRLSAAVGPVEGVADVDREFGDQGFAPIIVTKGLKIERALQIVEVTLDHLTMAYEVLDGNGLYQVALLRFLVNGQVDSTFGDEGVVVFPKLPEPTRARVQATETKDLAATAGANGKALAKGQMLLVAYKLIVGQKFSYLIKVNADGSLDPVFAGGAGYVRLSFTGNANDSEYKVSVDSKERSTVVSGSADGTRVVAARFTADGVLDPGFGGSGFIEITSPAGAIRQPAVGIDNNDRVVISVKHLPANSGLEGLYLFRLDDGASDPTFNNGRPIEWTPEADRTLHTTDHIATDEQRRIVLRSVYANRNTGARGLLVSRFTAQGIDSSFGESGSVALPGNGSFYGGLIIQSGRGGAIVVSDRQDLWKIMT